MHLPFIYLFIYSFIYLFILALLLLLLLASILIVLMLMALLWNPNQDRVEGGWFHLDWFHRPRVDGVSHRRGCCIIPPWRRRCQPICMDVGEGGGEVLRCDWPLPWLRAALGLRHLRLWMMDAVDSDGMAHLRPLEVRNNIGASILLSCNMEGINVTLLTFDLFPPLL